MNKNGRIHKIFSILLVLIGLLVIFIFSSKNANESNETSTSLIDKAISETLNVTNKTGITDKHPTQEKKESVIKKMNVPVRKCAHASIYFVLSLVLVNLFRSFKVGKYKAAIFSLLICFIYAITDEYHQTFVIGRTGLFTDVLIDTTGAFISCILSLIYFSIKDKRKKKVIFVSSIGGHLTQLLTLSELFEDYKYTLITERGDVTKNLKEKYKVKYYHYCNKSNYLKYFIINVLNAFHAVYTYITIRPDVIVTTGANTCVPLCYLGALFGSKVIFIESFAKREGKTLAGSLVYPVATHFIVQWKSMKKSYPQAIYFGGIY